MIVPAPAKKEATAKPADPVDKAIAEGLQKAHLPTVRQHHVEVFVIERAGREPQVEVYGNQRRAAVRAEGLTRRGTQFTVKRLAVIR
jgi:hypothetical protein